MTSPRTLAQWQAYIETVHHRTIELGLERVRAVLQRMDLARPACPVVTVAGTNGKGSCAAMLESVLHTAGYLTGAYTSPHLIAYNERVRVGAVPAADAELCAAFAAVEAARGEVPLTYFEFGTLAALDVFRRREVDALVLEVGMGGRLDAVNALDADAAVVTSVDLDHTDWLGDDREQIGREKAGIFRPGRVAVCADADPPAGVLAVARDTGARLYRAGRDFGYRSAPGCWDWWGPGGSRRGLPYPGLGGGVQLANASAVLMALWGVRDRLPVDRDAIECGLSAATLPGRFQVLPGRPQRVLDVAHNVAAARNLLRNLAEHPVGGRTLMVCAMLADKPVAQVLRLLDPVADRWYLAPLHEPRGADEQALRDFAGAADLATAASYWPDPPAAFRAACEDAGPRDRVVAFGSFYTVGAILRALGADGADSMAVSPVTSAPRVF